VHNIYKFTIFYELLKTYREGLRVSSRGSLVITDKFMTLRVVEASNRVGLQNLFLSVLRVG